MARVSREEGGTMPRGAVGARWGYRTGCGGQSDRGRVAPVGLTHRSSPPDSGRGSRLVVVIGGADFLKRPATAMRVSTKGDATIRLSTAHVADSSDSRIAVDRGIGGWSAQWDATRKRRSVQCEPLRLIARVILVAAGHHRRDGSAARVRKTPVAGGVGLAAWLIDDGACRRAPTGQSRGDQGSLWLALPRSAAPRAASYRAGTM
jgi:hypothetical protein